MKTFGRMWGRVALGMLVAPAALAASVRASSELTVDGERHPAELAVDGRLETAWAEDETGVGEGSWVELKLDRPTEIHSVSLWAGNLERGVRSLKEDGRPNLVTVVFDEGGEGREVEIRIRDGAEHGVQRSDLRLESPITARLVRFVVKDAYAGFLHNDTYIAEVAVNFVSGPGPDLGRLEAWQGSSSGEKAATAHREDVIELFGRIDQSEFGDREALAELMSYAADGAPYLRARVLRDAPMGFRVAALPPDDVAVQALLKIKDANAIPALQLAALRTTGTASRKLQATVTYFEAYAEMKSGGRRVLPAWGSKGWEPGALRGFGEPLSIARGEAGDSYVADVANHRLSIFDPDGELVRTVGAPGPEITDRWYGKRRAHYVTGSAPGNKPGTFFHPLDVEVLPTRLGDEVLVVDASRRVQWFDVDGKLKATFKVPAELEATPGVGGIAHVLYAKKKVVVIWGTDVFVFDDAGEVVAQWQVEDGAPTTADVLKNGRLLLGVRSGAVEYSVDGFRFAVSLEADELPMGFEAWDLTVDEKGKVWVVTDHGWVLKYAKPGKEMFRVRWSDVGVGAVRAVAEQDRLWITHDGEITPFDALTALAEAAEDDAE